MAIIPVCPVCDETLQPGEILEEVAAITVLHIVEEHPEKAMEFPIFRAWVKAQAKLVAPTNGRLIGV